MRSLRSSPRTLHRRLASDPRASLKPSLAPSSSAETKSSKPASLNSARAPYISRVDAGSRPRGVSSEPSSPPQSRRCYHGLQEGPGEEVSVPAGVASYALGWGALSFDFDNDGHQEL